MRAAEALLADGGASALSVRRVAEAAGTTSRAIYSVFGGRDGLVGGLLREAFVALAADLDALPVIEDPLDDLVAAGVKGFRGWARRRPNLFRLAFSEDTPARSTPDQAGVAAFSRLRLRVRRCIDSGLMAEGLELDVALSFHALCEGLALFESRGRFPLVAGRDPEQMWRSALTSLVRGYCA